jgi:hypothetical protein
VHKGALPVDSKTLSQDNATLSFDSKTLSIDTTGPFVDKKPPWQRCALLDSLERRVDRAAARPPRSLVVLFLGRGVRQAQERPRQRPAPIPTATQMSRSAIMTPVSSPSVGLRTDPATVTSARTSVSIYGVMTPSKCPRQRPTRFRPARAHLLRGSAFNSDAR